MVAPPWPGCLSMTLDEISSLDSDGVTALAWSSLAEGYFAGRDGPSWTSEENEQRRRRAAQLAQERATTATAVAIAYVLRQPARVVALVGTRSEAHLDELLDAAALPLSPKEIAWLESGPATT